MKEQNEIQAKQNEEGKHSPVTTLLKNLREKKGWQIAAVTILAFIFILFLNPGSKKDKQKNTRQVEQTELKREVYSEKDLKQMLQEVEARVNQKQSSANQTRHQQRRNYATDTAAFIYKEKSKGDSRPFIPRPKKAKFGLSAGTKIPAYIEGTIFSFNVADPVVAVISKDIEKDGRFVIPKDSHFLGEAAVLKSLNRINVTFDLLILPDGQQMRVRGMALSEDGSSGIKGKVDKHRDTRVFKAIGETLLAGASLFTGPRSDPYSLESQLRQNFADNLTQQARQDLRSIKVDTSVTVKSYTAIQVILLENI